MTKFAYLAGAAAAAVLVTSPAFAKSSKASSGAQDQQRGTAEIPRCARKIGSLAIVEPDNQWWRELNLGSPEAILRVFVQQSGCFTLVNRGRSMQSRAMEKALAEDGELRRGSQVEKKHQVIAAQYFMEPNIVSTSPGVSSPSRRRMRPRVPARSSARLSSGNSPSTSVNSSNTPRGSRAANAVSRRRLAGSTA